MTFEFRGDLWLWPGDAPWVFVTVPPDTSDEVLEIVPRTGGFGSVRVEVTIGSTVWRTSLFPDSQRGSYVLPIKRAVREAEAIGVGDAVDVRLRLIGYE